MEKALSRLEGLKEGHALNKKDLIAIHQVVKDARLNGGHAQQEIDQMIREADEREQDERHSIIELNNQYGQEFGGKGMF